MTLGLEFLTSHQRDNEYEELCSVFVPTNHLYIGEIFLVDSKYIIRPNLSIREGIGDVKSYTVILIAMLFTIILGSHKGWFNW